ncbi:MAG: GEVED domain-containing protein [Psychroserpens sp.]|uniref:GEVED domain-containing protein n=1 Tax=Psychroserpens sp. TaxID=2020870 RepID=UPI0030032BD6
MMKKLLFFSIFIFFLSFGLQAQVTIDIDIPDDYTFIVPCDVTSITVEIWGAGGGGYGDNNNDNIIGRGGGGGAYSTAILPVNGGDIINLTVGAGGIFGSPVGGDGGNTSFSTLIANGGTGGDINTGGIGGTASGGDTNLPGTNGNTVGGVSPNGFSGGNAGGPGGGIGGIGGGNGNDGNPGNIPGGGGGASGDRSGGSENGGAGANGRVSITFTTALSAYCTSTFTIVEPITNVTFAGINNTTSNTVNGSSDTESFCDIATVIQGNTTNQITIKGNTAGNFDNYIRAYFDWDQDGTFGNNANEIYDLGIITNSTGNDTATLTSNISVPVTATVGNTKMRITKNYNAYVTGPCANHAYGQSEDYIVNVVAPAPCTTPTAQPIALFLTPSGTTIVGSFTASNPVADNYLVLVSALNTPPTFAPVNGNTYNIGAAYDVNYTVVDNDTNTTFTATGLTPLTAHYFYIYAFNSICSGGPLYYTVNPLTGNTTTLVADYCEPTSDDSDGLYINNVAIVGSLSDPPANASTFSTSPNGYQDFTSLTNIAVQAQGEALNVLAYSTGEILLRGTWKAWVDWNVDGDFDDVGEEVYNLQGFAGSSVTFGFIIPLTQTPGNYRIRIRVNNGLDIVGINGFENFGFNFTSCDNFSTAASSPKYWGETEDYLISVIPTCSGVINTVIDGETCGPGSVNLAVTGNGTSYNWYDTETPGTGTLLETNAGSYTTDPLTNTTSYWVTANNGICESVTRTEVIAEVNSLPTLTFTQSATSICGNDIVAITAGGDTEVVYLLDEDFEGGGLGVFENINTDTNNAATDNKTRFQNQTSVHIPNTNVWFPAISSGFGADNFALGLSDASDPDYPSVPVENSLTLTNGVDTNGFTNLTLELDFYYSRFFPTGINPTDEYATIELSTDNGASYPTVLQTFTENTGIASNFISLSYNLTPYIDTNDLKIRVRLYSFAGAGWLPDGIAVDDIKIYGDKPLNTAFDWNVTVDAFSDPAATIPYISGTSVPVPTIYVNPTSGQLGSNNTFTFTASAILSNGCSASQDITVTNNTKIWNGSQGTSTWNDPNNWSPTGIPTSDNCVIVKGVGILPDPTILGPPLPPTPAYARNLTVKADGYLELQSSTSLTVTDWITIEPTGTLDVRSSANLVQITNVATNNNTGSINMQREVTGLSSSDYVYWASAVEGFGTLGVSPGTNATHVLEWRPTVGGIYGEWQTSIENMISGKGYAIRGLTGTTTANTAEFSGRPSNGIINRAITRGNYTGTDYPGPGSTVATAIDDNWNLVGNPFPSSIYADTFITMNASNIIDDLDPSISGTVYLWRHLSAPSNAVTDPFYGDYVYNYNPNDYVAYNLTGSTPIGFDGFIGAGQAFFVLMDNAATSPSNLVFDNTMRSGVYGNDQFYRLDNSADEDTTVVEKNRIWLDLIDNNNNAISILVGYISGATNEKDRLFDGNELSGTSTLFYSLVENEKMSIQGRSLPFNVNDTVTLGFEIPQNGNYSIAINNIDGLFETTNQDIFLEDTFTHTIHDLRLSAYSFTSESGTFNDRFILLYTDTTLSTNEPESLDGLSIIAPDGKYIKIESTLSPIELTMIYDLMGRVVIDTKYANNPSELRIETNHLSSGSYVVKVTLTDGKEKTQKVILK